MTNTFRRVSLSVDESEPISMPAPRGFNKGRLMMWITAGATVLTVATAALGLYKWHEGEAALTRASTIKADTESAKLLIDRRISDIDSRYAEKLKQLETLLTQKDTELRDQQIKTEKTAQRKNTEEAELAAAKKQVELVNAELADGVTRPLIPLLHESTGCSVTRDYRNCGLGYLIAPPAYRASLSDGPPNPLRDPYADSGAPPNMYKDRSAALPDPYWTPTTYARGGSLIKK